jgi:uncharacterized protein
MADSIWQEKLEIRSPLALNLGSRRLRAAETGVAGQIQGELRQMAELQQGQSRSQLSQFPSNQAQQNQSQQRQRLPITARMTIAGQVIRLEVARTPQQQAIGLMNRQTLPRNRGMLFPFDPPRSVRFWMRDVSFPLDMVFIREGTVRAIAQNVPPCNTERCPTYGAPTAVDQVIELRGGRSAELGLRTGSRIRVRFIKRQ